MASSHKLADSALSQEIYSGGKFLMIKMVLLGLALFVLGFSLNFPINSTIEAMLTKSLTGNRSCPIRFDSMVTELFLPKVSIDNLQVSGSCFQKPSQVLVFDKVVFSLKIPSLFPPGLKIHSQISGEKSKIESYPLIGFGEQKVPIVQSQIDGTLLGKLIGMPELLQGSLTLQALIETKNGKLSSGNFKIDSQNLNINYPSLFPKGLPIKIFGFSGEYSSRNILKVKRLVIGQEGGAVFAKFKGTVKIDPSAPNMSETDLMGEIAFDEEFLNSDLPLLKLLWDLDNRQKKEGGFYHINIKGPLQAALQKPIFL